MCLPCLLQAVLSLVLIAVCIAYLAATFRCPLPSDLPDNLAVNDAGQPVPYEYVCRSHIASNGTVLPTVLG